MRCQAARPRSGSGPARGGWQRRARASAATGAGARAGERSSRRGRRATAGEARLGCWARWRLQLAAAARARRGGQRRRVARGSGLGASCGRAGGANRGAAQALRADVESAERGVLRRRRAQRQAQGRSWLGWSRTPVMQGASTGARTQGAGEGAAVARASTRRWSGGRAGRRASGSRRGRASP
jgi:hypothetical protein